MYEIRIFRYRGEEMPAIYHRANIAQVTALLSVLSPCDFFRVEIVNIEKY